MKKIGDLRNQNSTFFIKCRAREEIFVCQEFLWNPTSFTYLLYFIYNHWMNTLDSWKTYNSIIDWVQNNKKKSEKCPNFFQKVKKKNLKDKKPY